MGSEKADGMDGADRRETFRVRLKEISCKVRL
jgi:hypothetical protein